jgi:NAD(P)-dependent dehydrogenase (short-subunit alcohol dehydrogenase family)
MSENLQDQIVLVTGGTRGIGRAIVERLLAQGCRVAFCGRTEAGVRRSLEELAQGGHGNKVLGRAADITNQTELEALFQAVDQEWGGLDILVNNAGIGIFRPVAELTMDDWKATIDTNLTAVYAASRLALERFVRSEGGFIVNLGSLAGKNAFAGGAAYNASKFGLVGFSEAMMLDHRHQNVRVCTILPGSVNTDFSPRSARADWKIAPEDVADVVVSVLRMPRRTMVSHVEMRPSRPAK